MNDVKVEKKELREKVQKNRDAHRQIFEEAVAGYQAQALKILEDHVAEIKAGAFIRVEVRLPLPEDHTADYDRVLAMIDMSVEDEVTLAQDDFAAYVMDDWHWKRAFLQNNAGYSDSAFAAARRF